MSHLEVVNLTVVATKPGDRVRQRAVHIVNADLFRFSCYSPPFLRLDNIFDVMNIQWLPTVCAHS